MYFPHINCFLINFTRKFSLFHNAGLNVFRPTIPITLFKDPSRRKGKEKKGAYKDPLTRSFSKLRIDYYMTESLKVLEFAWSWSVWLSLQHKVNIYTTIIFFIRIFFFFKNIKYFNTHEKRRKCLMSFWIYITVSFFINVRSTGFD